MDEKKIEEKIEQVAREFEQKAKQIGDALDEKIKRHLDEREAGHHHHVQRQKNTEFWGIILLVFGFLLLADNLHWFRWDIPIFPLAIIAVGVYLLFFR